MESGQIGSHESNPSGVVMTNSTPLMLQLQVFGYLSVHIVLGLQLPRKKNKKRSVFKNTKGSSLP